MVLVCWCGYTIILWSQSLQEGYAEAGRIKGFYNLHAVESWFSNARRSLLASSQTPGTASSIIRTSIKNKISTSIAQEARTERREDKKPKAMLGLENRDSIEWNCSTRNWYLFMIHFCGKTTFINWSGLEIFLKIFKNLCWYYEDFLHYSTYRNKCYKNRRKFHVFYRDIRT